ncbi:MAG TPA: OmpA family protein [Spirochaetota bacterium]|nr:OmpA family protein [Spirochaetota bacterium]
MKYTKKILLFLLISLSYSEFCLYARQLMPQQPAGTENNISLKVSLKFLQRKYKINEPVKVRITVFNQKKNEQTIRLKLHNNMFEHFKFVLSDQNDRKIDHTIKYLAWQHRNQQGEQKQPENNGKRMIELKPEESYTTVINVLDWFKIKEAGLYFLQGSFLPNFELKTEQYSFHIPPASFHIINDYAASKQKAVRIEKTESEPLQDYFPPDAVVEKFINAQQEQNWNKMLQCIAAERFLKNSYMTTEIYERFQDARTDERKVVLEDFKNFLIKSIDYKITKYQIMHTEKSFRTADVKVKMQTKASSQKYVKKINPVTGQMQVSWETNSKTDFTENRVVYFRLQKINRNWKITHKVVSIHKSYNFPDRDAAFSFPPPGRPIRISNVLFDLGKYRIKPRAVKTLNQVVKLMQQNKNLKIELRGHTDYIGGDRPNRALSKQRALAVYNFLTAKDISQKRIFVKWFGEQRPLTDNSNPAKRRINRRVEFKIIER